MDCNVPLDHLALAANHVEQGERDSAKSFPSLTARALTSNNMRKRSRPTKPHRDRLASELSKLE
jgi:hypothetical protein